MPSVINGIYGQNEQGDVLANRCCVGQIHTFKRRAWRTESTATTLPSQAASGWSDVLEGRLWKLHCRLASQKKVVAPLLQSMPSARR